MKTRTILYAEEGRILTNGETYGRQIILPMGDIGFSYYEISEKEYEEIMEQQQQVEQI